MLNWEECTCDWCGDYKSELMFEGTDLLLNLPGVFRFVRCINCGLIRQNPRLNWESLKLFYPQDYCAYDSIIDLDPSWIQRTQRRYGMKKRLKEIEKFQPKGRLLDIGCGSGIFLAEAFRSGHWDVIGVEPIEEATENIRKLYDITIINNRISEVVIDGDQFDVITMWNVLEHLENPITDLRKATGLLRDRGFIVISIPNLNSLGGQIFGHSWIGWDLPRHLYHFPKNVFRDILTELGYTVKEIRCISGSHAAFELWLSIWLNNISSGNNTRFISSLYQSLPIKIITGIPFWTIDQLKLSSFITYIAQKQ